MSDKIRSNGLHLLNTLKTQKIPSKSIPPPTSWELNSAKHFKNIKMDDKNELTMYPNFWKKISCTNSAPNPDSL